MERIHRTQSPDGKGRETVSEKALRLFRSGRVRREHGAVWVVRGDTGTYRVDLYREGCNCPARGECSHFVAASVASAKLDRRTTARLEAARERARARKGSGLSSAAILANLAGFPSDAA